MIRDFSRKGTIFFLLLLLSICSIAPLLMLPESSQAAPAISARFEQSHGTQLVIEIMAGPNPPASAILVQQFPAGITMIDARPPASNYNQRSNTAKWLLRNLRPGRSTINITLDHPVKGSDVSAELRFKPQGGAMTSVQVTR